MARLEALRDVEGMTYGYQVVADKADQAGTEGVFEGAALARVWRTSSGWLKYQTGAVGDGYPVVAVPPIEVPCLGKAIRKLVPR